MLLIEKIRKPFIKLLITGGLITLSFLASYHFNSSKNESPKHNQTTITQTYQDVQKTQSLLNSDKEFDEPPVSDNLLTQRIFKPKLYGGAIPYEHRQQSGVQDTFNYTVHSKNASIDDAKVVLLGEIHGKYDAEVFIFLDKYAKEGDVFVSEGSQKDEEILPLTDLEKIIKKDLRIYGADDLKLTKECAEYIISFSDLYHSVKDDPLKAIIHIPTLDLLKDKIDELQEKREEIFYDVISTLSKKYKDAIIYFKVGSLHITNSSITSKLEEEGIKYIALIPQDEKSSFRDSKKHIEKLKETMYEIGRAHV